MNAERIAFLENQVAAQAETIRHLRAAMVDDVHVPLEWGLAHREKQIFLLLVRREVQTTETLHGAIYASAGLGDVDPDTIHSHISKMRTKLARFGITVLCRRNEGYRLVGRERFAPLAKAVA